VFIFFTHTESGQDPHNEKSRQSVICAWVPFNGLHAARFLKKHQRCTPWKPSQFISLEYLPIHGLGQTHEPPHLQRQHISCSTVCPQNIMNIWCAIGAKSAFEIPCIVGLQPKFALVDTFSHASCENGRNVGNQSAFPIT
jgi:hypothetical protein